MLEVRVDYYKTFDERVKRKKVTGWALLATRVGNKAHFYFHLMSSLYVAYQSFMTFDCFLRFTFTFCYVTRYNKVRSNSAN